MEAVKTAALVVLGLALGALAFAFPVIGAPGEMVVRFVAGAACIAVLVKAMDRSLGGSIWRGW